ncbi:MAG: hypothetical protein K9H06_15220, partial [Melioribacteraceae bacterium]|nr:hypothetical protein [Melioribacteraceae bacterium]
MNTFFNNVHGQDEVVTYLKKLYEADKIPHALLFHGSSGVGKFNVALEFSKFVNQKSTPKVIEKITSLSEPYIKYIHPLPRGKGETADDNPLDKLDKNTIDLLQVELKKKAANPYIKIGLEKANNIKISSIREIKRFLSLNFTDLQYRIIIIEDAHLMNQESQNALLKSLEEPPDGVLFILTTHKIEYLLPTIQSRCWNVKFNPLSETQIEKILTDFFEINNEKARDVSIISEGSISNAVNLIEWDYEKLMIKALNILRFSMARWYNSAFEEFAEIIELNDSKLFDQLLKLISFWLVDTNRNKYNYDRYYFYNNKDTMIKFNKKFANVKARQV